MCQLVESIKVDKREFFNLDEHSQRMHKARNSLFGATDYIDLKSRLSIPECLTDTIHKCRIVYDTDIRSISYAPYIFRPVRSLQLVTDNHADYTYKYLDRAWLTTLAEQSEKADDILIIKNGQITDTSRANIIFFDGSIWITPTSYLLNGTMRQKLLKSGVISEQSIHVDNLPKFVKARAINAFLDLETGDDISMEHIYK